MAWSNVPGTNAAVAGTGTKVWRGIWVAQPLAAFIAGPPVIATNADTGGLVTVAAANHTTLPANIFGRAAAAWLAADLEMFRVEFKYSPALTGIEQQGGSGQIPNIGYTLALAGAAPNGLVFVFHNKGNQVIGAAVAPNTFEIVIHYLG